MEKNKRMTTIIVAAILLLTVVGIAFAYFAATVINGTRQNLSATTVEGVNLTLDDNDSTSFSGQVSFGTAVTRNLKLTNEGGPTKVALYFQDLINTYTACAFTYTLSYATTENGSYTNVLTDVAIPRRSKASSTAKITEIDMPATSTRYYRIVITYNNLNANQTRDLTAQFNTGFTIKVVPKTIAEAHSNGDYLKDFCEADIHGNCQSENFSEEIAFGNTNIPMEQIYKVDTLNSKTPPTGTVFATNGSPWDVSAGQNGSIMAWVTNHEFENLYTSQSDCQTDLNSGVVSRCEDVEPFVYYARQRKSNGSFLTAKYDTLIQCQNGMSSSYQCVERTVITKGFYTKTNSYDLHLGQEGGVIANPNSSNMFNYYTKLEMADLSNLNTQYVTDMRNFFADDNNLTSVNFGDFDTSNVTNMSSMFFGCKFTSLNIRSFDTSNVTNMEYMFNGCNKLFTLDLSNFDTANVVNMSGMFHGVNQISSLNVSSFDTSNVTNVYSMFGYLTSAPLQILDLSNFDTASVTNARELFTHSWGFEQIRLDNADFDSITENYDMFYSSGDGLIYVNEKGKEYLDTNISDISSRLRVVS